MTDAKIADMKRMLAMGVSQVDIARTLGVSVQTIYNHKHRAQKA